MHLPWEGKQSNRLRYEKSSIEAANNAIPSILRGEPLFQSLNELEFLTTVFTGFRTSLAGPAFQSTPRLFVQLSERGVNSRP